MKKILLLSSAIFAALCNVNAQGWNTTGVHDDFATVSEYKNGSNLEGILWWGDAPFSFSRTGDGKMTVTATDAGGTNTGTTTGTARYPLIGVGFNDSNNDGSGTKFSVDLTNGADIQIDIENKSTTQQLYIHVILEDINGTQAKIEPNVADVAGTTWADANRKALNGFTLAANTRKNIVIDLSSVAGAVGGLTTGAYVCSGPNDCPVTTYSIDITKITNVLFLVNFGKDNIDLTEGDGNPLAETFISAADCAASAFNGDFIFHDFRVGSSVTNLKSESIINESINVYPNPANENFIVEFTSIEGADVTLTDIVGNEVYSVKGNVGSNSIVVNTSVLSAGIYLLNVATENGNVARKVNIK